MSRVGRSSGAPRPTPKFVDDHLLLVGQTEFHCEFPLGEVPAGRLPLMKSRRLVERYIDLCQILRPLTIVELGIRRGGSTALLNELAQPQKLVAVEIDKTPAVALTAYVAERGLSDVVRPFYDVDQSDRARLAEIVAAEFAGEGGDLDLVVDDASHLYEETRSSFETLFPRLRPGGLFVLEDWNWNHRRYEGLVGALNDPSQLAEFERRLLDPDVSWKPAFPLSRLVIELLLGAAVASSVFSEITIDEHWTAVRRGPGELDADKFRLSDLYSDPFKQLGPPTWSPDRADSAAVADDS